MAIRQKMSPELKFALETITQAGEIALKYYGSNTPIELKENDSPVTRADLECEQYIRDKISQAFPSYGVLGEEYGGEKENRDSTWVIDPIDGTKSFVRGVPLFGMLLGLQHEGKPTLGVAHFPALKETAWAEIGSGAYFNGKRITVSNVSNLKNALLLSGSINSILENDRMAGYLMLALQSGITRTWCDAYGHVMVATGRAEIMLDPAVKIWDTCAIMPIVMEAGGTFTDFSGNERHDSGNVISTNKHFLQLVLETFK